MQGAFDIAVVGSGFAGALTALIARRQGRSVVLLEKGKHPRFTIGESSTPLANLILEELCDRYDLPSVRAFTKWGTWQQSHPQVACGMKRGFTFYHHEAEREFADDASHQRQLLVAASPHDRIADTHWYRPDFDAFLVEEARQLGVVYLDEVDLWGVNREPKRPVLQGRHRGHSLEIHAGLIIDATGPRGFLHRAFDLPEVRFPHLPATQALYTHFTEVPRWDAAHPSDDAPPYPVDDAALHHVFDGGWLWVLRFNNGVTSAGVAATTKLANELRFAEGEPAWRRLLEKFPSIRAHLGEAKVARPFIHAPKPAFLSGDIAGPNWALLPSAAGFVDPLLSNGFPLTLLGVERLARILENNWDRAALPDELCQYSMQTTVELMATERLVAALYASMHDFELFTALTLLYFAAASFTESARRLGKPELAGNTFLLGEHAWFGPRLRDCTAAALRKPVGAARAALLINIQQTIAPVNVAGLGDPERHNWYPARAEDLFASAGRLQSSPGEIEAMLKRGGF